jgi:hypothetical protein
VFRSVQEIGCAAPRIRLKSAAFAVISRQDNAAAAGERLYAGCFEQDKFEPYLWQTDVADAFE